MGYQWNEKRPTHWFYLNVQVDVTTDLIYTATNWTRTVTTMLQDILGSYFTCLYRTNLKCYASHFIDHSIHYTVVDDRCLARGAYCTMVYKRKVERQAGKFIYLMHLTPDGSGFNHYMGYPFRLVGHILYAPNQVSTYHILHYTSHGTLTNITGINTSNKF